MEEESQCQNISGHLYTEIHKHENLEMSPLLLGQTCLPGSSSSTSEGGGALGSSSNVVLGTVGISSNLGKV